MDPLGRVGGRAVHEALQRLLGSWRPLGGVGRAFPLEDRGPHGGALVHDGAVFKLIQEAQHPLVHGIDLPGHAVAVPRQVQ